jgi:hypothetical protein
MEVVAVGIFIWIDIHSQTGPLLPIEKGRRWREVAVVVVLV